MIAEYCHRLDLAGIIDRACPIRTGVAILTHGQVIEALVANRLTSPAPLLRVTDWARTWAIEGNPKRLAGTAAPAIAAATVRAAP